MRYSLILEHYLGIFKSSQPSQQFPNTTWDLVHSHEAPAEIPENEPTNPHQGISESYVAADKPLIRYATVEIVDESPMISLNFAGGLNLCRVQRYGRLILVGLPILFVHSSEFCRGAVHRLINIMVKLFMASNIAPQCLTPDIVMRQNSGQSFECGNVRKGDVCPRV